jgi:hypothetical protein
MEDRFRFLTTSIIWVAFAVVLVTLFIALAATNADMTEFQFLVLAAFVMFLTAIAGISTVSIWRAPRRADESLRQDSGKSKRVDASRLQRLVDEMDEDDIIELETLLRARDYDTLE